MLQNVRRLTTLNIVALVLTYARTHARIPCTRLTTKTQFRLLRRNWRSFSLPASEGAALSWLQTGSRQAHCDVTTTRTTRHLSCCCRSISGNVIFKDGVFGDLVNRILYCSSLSRAPLVRPYLTRKLILWHIGLCDSHVRILFHIRGMSLCVANGNA